MSVIDKAIKSVIVGFFILFPVFYLGITPESYEFNKMALLVGTTLILLVLTALKIAREKRFTLPSNTFTLPLFFLTTIYLISTLFQSPSFMLSLITPLSSATIIAGFIFFLLLIYNLESVKIQSLFSFLVIDACLISLFVLLQNLGIFPDNSFTPAGTLLATVTFLAIISIYLLTKIVRHVVLIGGDASEKDTRILGYLDIRSKTKIAPNILISQYPNIILYFLAFLLVIGTTIFLAFQLFTTAKPVLLPIFFGWTIFLEVLKNIRTLLLGVGPTNFVIAFSLTKPLAFNSTPYWNVIFTSSSSFFLNLLTETGILTGFFYLIIVFKTIKLLSHWILNAGDVKEGSQTELHKEAKIENYTLDTRRLEAEFGKPERQDPQIIIPLLFTLLLQLFLPGNMVVFITTIILLSLATNNQKSREINLNNIAWLGYLIVVPTIILVAALAYFGGKFYLAEAYFKKSLDALLNNQGERVYNFQNQAIMLNPYVDRYHVAFSRTNLVLANAIAAKETLTDTDKGNIPTLVKQAIDQARIAVVLNRTNETNWDNLGRVYSSIIGYAQGAENWAISTFQQKLILDPLNPNTYLAVASLNLNLKNYIEAENYALRAVNAKPDFANAHYFLNLSLQGQKRYKEAHDSLAKTLSLLPTGSPDAQKVAEELQKLAKLLPKGEATGGGTVENVTDQSQTLELTPATSSAIQNLPENLPTISLPQLN